MRKGGRGTGGRRSTRYSLRLTLTLHKDRHLTSGQAPRSHAQQPGIGRLRVVPCERVIDQPWGNSPSTRSHLLSPPKT